MLANDIRLRTITRIVTSVKTKEGGGFVVRRPFPSAQLSHCDPFLMLDHLGPVNYGPNEAVGAPDHPHRGFEAISYVLEGWWQHKDSVGHSGVRGPGDVQWMTAGAGIVHSEMPEAGFKKSGGIMNGFQIWVNLPRKDKMTTPRYQDLAAAQIPMGQSEDGKVRVKVIAGEALGVKASINTHTPIIFLHYTIEPGGVTTLTVPQDHNIFAYVIDGTGTFGPTAQVAQEGQLVLFEQDGDSVRLAVPGEATVPMNVLLLGGVPLREPIAWYGPFVMNTEAEIYQAIEDYQSGKMGSIEF